MPMKNLLAEVMTKENESRRRSPSLIGRLMGLDGMPPQQPVHKQLKRNNENGLEKVQKSSTFYNRQSSRKNSKDEQEFKDVFEVLDSKKVEATGNSRQSIGNSKRVEAEMAFIQQKFMDVKRLSTDEKLHDSKEFDDALEVLDSNKDLLLKFLQQPDSLFTKHLHDLQKGLPEPHCSRVPTVKSSQPLRSENSSLSQRTQRESQRKNHSRSPHNCQADTLNHSSAVLGPLKLSKVRVEEKNHQALQPMKIVVLKPNLEKSQNATRISSSPRSSHYLPSDCRKHKELLDIKTREADIWGKKKVSGDLETLRPNSSRESREIAREITRKMRNTLTNSSVNFSTSKFRGYAGDESSSGSESATDSNVTKVTFEENFNRNNRRRSSYIRSSESPVSREAKKRLSERWKMAHRAQEVRVDNRGSTLGEMLAIPVTGVRRANYRSTTEEKRSHKFDQGDGRSSLFAPLGISSKDGWRDACHGSLSRSRSLPSSADLQNPRANLHQDNVCSGAIYVLPKDGQTQDASKPIKGKFSPSEGSQSMNSNSSMNKSRFLSMNDNEESSTPQHVDLPDWLVTNSIKDDGQSVDQPLVPVASADSLTATSSLHENEMNVNNHNATVIAEPCHQELLASSSINSHFSAGDLDALASEEIHDGQQEGAPLHCPETQRESHPSSKEVDQPSPVSVFEAPFTDEPSSSSECFESLSADIHGLRLQLQLLKSENEGYAEGSMVVVSSDDDADEVSSRFVNDKGTSSRAEEYLESSYIANVLADSGINGTDPDTFTSTWYSPDCPLNSSVFEELEKKYSNQTSSWSRAERKLIFDRINLQLLEIYHQSTPQHPWVKKTARSTHPKWNKQELEDSLRKLLAVQDKKAKKDVTNYVIGSELQWLDLIDDIDIIGREIERLLIDELVAEVAAVL